MLLEKWDRVRHSQQFSFNPARNVLSLTLGCTYDQWRNSEYAG